MSLLLLKQRQTKVNVPAIHRQPVTLETKVPEKIRSEDFLPAPDEGAFHKALSKVKMRIKQVKGKLAEKTGVQDNEALLLSQLEEKKAKLQSTQLELHKKRKEIEVTLKSFIKTIKAVFYSF